MLSYMAKTFFSESPVLAYPIFALLLFLLAFLFIAIRVWRSNPAELERLARLPLDDAPRVTDNTSGSRKP